MGGVLVMNSDNLVSLVTTTESQAREHRTETNVPQQPCSSSDIENAFVSALHRRCNRIAEGFVSGNVVQHLEVPPLQERRSQSV